MNVWLPCASSAVGLVLGSTFANAQSEGGPPAQGAEPTEYRQPNRVAAGATKPRSEPLPAPEAVYEPPIPGGLGSGSPKPPTPHRAPWRSLWLGARAGWFMPQGAIWVDGTSLDGACCLFETRPFRDFAGPGPKLEANVGVRLARHYIILGSWEHASLSDGRLLNHDLGGQEGGTTQFWALGFRFSGDPDRWGIAVEADLGVRTFATRWADGTELRADDDFISTRLGVGVDIRLADNLTLSPMLSVSGGSFTDITWKYVDGSEESALTPFDDFGQHGNVALEVGAHYDAFGTRD